MAHAVGKKVAAVGRRVRLLWLLHGLALAIGLGLGLAIVLVVLDYAIGFEDRGIRVMASGSLWLATCWLVYRFLWIPLRSPLTPLDVALRLERRFPQLREQLAASIEFLNEPTDDARFGSAQLRRAVVQETSQLLEPLDLRQAIDHRPLIRAILVGTTALVLAGLALAFRPHLTLVGARRLIHPWGSQRWPQQTHLTLRRAVHSVAAGQAFEVEVVDRDRLPDEVWMLYRTYQPDGSVHLERTLLPIVSGAAIARREHVLRPFAYRAIGGDDQSMPWTEVQVLDPPALASLRITLHFPPYTGWPARAGDKHLRAITGTRVAIEGAATKPLRSAKVVYEDGREVHLGMAADKVHFSLPADAAAPLVIDKTGSYWFQLEDLGGLVGGTDSRYEMRAVADLEPSVSLDMPGGNMLATPQAAIPVRVTASDDLAIREIRLVYWRSDQSDKNEQSLVLYDGPATVAAAEQAAPQASAETGQRRTADHRWQLASLNLSPGTQLTIHATATDYQPATGRSTTRQIAIVTAEELERKLEDREALLLGELNRVLKLEQTARAHVEAVQIQAERVGSVVQQDLDRLHAAILAQRQVAQALAAREDGVQAQLAGLLADMQNNDLDNPELQRRTEAIRAELSRLQHDVLPHIERSLTAAEKSLPADGRADRLTAGADVVGQLNSAGLHQDQVIASLQRLLGDLSQWDSQRRIVRELTAFQQQQSDLAQRTAQLGRGTLSKNLSQLTAQQQADLKKLAAQQQELARRLESTLQNMARGAQQLEQENPLDAQAIADALARANDEALASTMHEAGRNIEQNRIGQAGGNQKKSLEELQEMLDILANKREQELARLVKKLRQSEIELKKLRADHAGLDKKLAEAAKEADTASARARLQRLAKEERQFQEQAARFGRRLQRLQADRSSSAVGQAADRMGEASRQGEQGEAEDASQSAALAQRDLEEAQQELARRRREAERDLAFEQFSKAQDELIALRDREAKALEETRRLDSLRQPDGSLSRAQLESVLGAANAQQDIADQTQHLARRLADAEAFGLALKNAIDNMSAAVSLLKKHETGNQTVKRQQRALAHLQQLVAALTPDKEDVSTPAQDQESQAGSAEGAPKDQVPDVAQLKLIKLMQQDLNERTIQIAALLAGDSSSNREAQQEMQRLGAEQGRLADVIRNLASPTSDEPDETADDFHQLLEGNEGEQPSP